jgi:chromosome segregation ATPase
MQDRMQNMEQRARAASEESARSAEQQRREQLRSELAQQQENLRREIQSLNEQLRTATERATVGTGALRQEVDRLRTDLQRMGQTVGRIERERLDAQVALEDNVQQLRDHIGDLRGNQMQMQGVLSAMLAQSGRSTVGSAGYTWGW